MLFRRGLSQPSSKVSCCCSYVVASNRILLVVKDGSAAWPIKDFLVKQERCQDVTIEGKDYVGRGSPYYVEVGFRFTI